MSAKERLEIELAQNENGDFVQELKLLSADATVDDFFRAFERFCEEKTASCYGCVGCCQERVPVTVFDAEKLMLLLPESERSLKTVCERFLNIYILPDGAVDICLKSHPDGSCIFMDMGKSCCKVHPYRTFACATHYCLARSEAINDIRSAVINLGMDELVRRLIAEGLLPEAKTEDYPQNVFSGKNGYAEILLCELSCDIA